MTHALTVRNVPLPRPLYLGSKGIDVVAVKRGLARAGFMQWAADDAFTPIFGPYTVKAVKAFQRAHKIAPATGGYGLKTHAALLAAHRTGHPKEPAFDSYALTLLRQEAEALEESPEERARRLILSAARFWYEHRYSIDYRQVRPYPREKPPDVPRALDCSAYATLCYYAAGAPDPNGRGYDGQGYTGTLIGHGTRVGLADLKPGDLVFYGFTTRVSPAFPYGSPTHVAIYDGRGGVFSNGHHPLGHYPVRYRPVNAFVHYRVTR